MADILHRVGIKSSSPDNAYKALTTREGLSTWWTNNTQGESKVGGVIQFRFGARGGFDMKVLEFDPTKRVLWQVVDGPEEWIGTKVSFDLKQLRFHQNAPELNGRTLAKPTIACLFTEPAEAKLNLCEASPARCSPGGLATE